jgi:hypothetical protein
VGAGWLATLGVGGAFVACVALVVTARTVERREYTAR